MMDLFIRRLLALTVCFCIVFSVVVLGWRVLQDGLGSQVSVLTDDLSKLALTGVGALTAEVLGVRLLARYQGKEKEPSE